MHLECSEQRLCWSMSWISGVPLFPSDGGPKTYKCYPEDPFPVLMILSVPRTEMVSMTHSGVAIGIHFIHHATSLSSDNTFCPCAIVPMMNQVTAVLVAGVFMAFEDELRKTESLGSKVLWIVLGFHIIKVVVVI